MSGIVKLYIAGALIANASSLAVVYISLLFAPLIFLGLLLMSPLTIAVIKQLARGQE